MTMRRVGILIAFALAAVAAIVVYRSTLEHALLVAVSGWLAWRLLLGRAGAGRRSGLLRWLWRALETAWVGWVTVNVGRARRQRISEAECRPIGGLLPVYSGRRVSSKPRFAASTNDAGSGNDEIPF